MPDNDYRGFLKRRIPELEAEVAGGSFLSTTGEKLGEHKGYPFYTVGQRKGLEIALGEPMYVTDIQPDTNTVVLGKAKDLLGDSMRVKAVNMVKYAKLESEMEAVTKIRYKHEGAPSLILQDGDEMEVKFFEKVSAIAPGQSAVFYEGEDLIGGGFIK